MASNPWAKGPPPGLTRASTTDEPKLTSISCPQHTFDTASFRELADAFHEQGYVVIHDAVPPHLVAQLRADMDSALSKSPQSAEKRRHIVLKRFFEHSPATVDLIEDSRLSDFAEYVIGDVPSRRQDNTSLLAHVIHNNAFSVPPGGRGQAPSWHVDDPPQQVVLPPGYVLPPEVKLPVLVCTYMIWLSDCETPAHGPTHVVPGSHRFGREPTPEEAEPRAVPLCGKAGTAALINANVWHRGCANASSAPRHTLQVTWARRIVGHKFGAIMNYRMPECVTQRRSDRLKRRLGWLPPGAYS